ncbi:transposase [Streptomyces zaomyceticus]|uniref:transposase n=1 Tax=Streptomyces zaomyceticus TaxID=68286 RepID=UPI002F90F8C1
MQKVNEDVAALFTFFADEYRSRRVFLGALAAFHERSRCTRSRSSTTTGSCWGSRTRPRADRLTRRSARGAADASAKALHEHVRSFAEILQTRSGQHLKDWIIAVRTADLPRLHAFATGLEKDWDAVLQGLSTRWNSGPVEGRVNHIKMVKRQMFGRAKLPLLRKRVLLTAAANWCPGAKTVRPLRSALSGVSGSGWRGV